MSKKIGQLNKEVIKGQIKELVRGSVSNSPVLYDESCGNSLAQSVRRWRSSGSNTGVLHLHRPKILLRTTRISAGGAFPPWHGDNRHGCNTFSDPRAAPARSIRTTGVFPPGMDLLSGNLSTTGYGKRRRRSGAVCRVPIPAESLFRSSGRSEQAADNSPAAFPAISYNGTAGGSVFRKTAASARLRRSARLVFHIPDIR